MFTESHPQLLASDEAKTMVSKELTKAFNRQWFVRYYPNSKDRHHNTLVSLTKLATLIDDVVVFENIINRLDECIDDRLEVRLRRGISFTFVSH